MKRILQISIQFIFLFWLLNGCQKIEQPKAENPMDTAAERKQIHQLLDAFNVAAAQANFDQYFSYYAEDAVFMGTDATEHWDKKAFMKWSKPFFDKKKAWSFSSMERHIYFSQQPDIAWFDELLNTQMKICRGSGVLSKQAGQWKIQQYVLSVTVPNSTVDSVVKIKAAEEDLLIQKLGGK